MKPTTQDLRNHALNDQVKAEREREMNDTCNLFHRGACPERSGETNAEVATLRKELTSLKAHEAEQFKTLHEALECLGKCLEQVTSLREQVAELEQARAICPDCARKIDEAAGVDVAALNLQVAELTQERDELKQSVSFWASHTPTDAYIDALEASQAREQQLRGVLSAVVSVTGMWEGSSIHKAVTAALALSSDDTALRQWGVKLLRNAAKELVPTDYFAYVELCRMADELDPGADEVMKGRT